MQLQVKLQRAYGLSVLVVLALLVLGAYVRLSNAGLSCPDWPACYGHWILPQDATLIDSLGEQYDRPLESAKAWKEILHRYLAAFVGLIIAYLACAQAYLQRQGQRQPGGALPYYLVGLVIFQALLGMWTVSYLVNPAIVTLHLIGGFLILSLLWWCYLARCHLAPCIPACLRTLVYLALVVLVVQILLGGWVSTNYAALACPDFPTCQGRWWPSMNLAEAFKLWHGPLDYEGGVLDSVTRGTIHFVHRLGALVVLAVFLTLGARLLWMARARRCRELMLCGWAVLLLLSVQIGLGIANVLLQLPLWSAMAHHAGAACLLLLTLYLLFRIEGEVVE